MRGEEANRIRFGIMGCAQVARKVARAIGLAPNAVVVAVASRSADKARSFAVDNGLPEPVTIHGSYESLLEDPEVDAVYMPLPTSLHLRWAVAAAESGKHLLLEKPVALSVSDLDRILAACGSNGVLFMDATMWMHHPRTAKIKEILSDPDQFGQLKMVHSTFFYGGGGDSFLKNDIRVKPDLDALGALGDVGWYAIRSILWAADYQLPKTAVALRNIVVNEAGVLLGCSASLIWEDGKIATFHCSFLANLTMDVSVIGTKGTLLLNDFVIPYEESSAPFTFASNSDFNGLVTGWNSQPSKHEIPTDLPQEALMVQEFARLVGGLKSGGGKPEQSWATISRKTQLVMDAVKASIDKGFEPVDIAA